MRADRQIGDFRHGVKRVTGSINGELSLGTHRDFVEAVLRGTGTAAVAKSQAELTSVAADNATSKFTFGGGDPVTEGYRVGMVIRFTNLSEALNNSKNFLITGFSGASNRDVSVHPAPITMERRHRVQRHLGRQARLHAGFRACQPQVRDRALLCGSRYFSSCSPNAASSG